MFSGEKRTVFLVLSIYLISTILLVVAIFGTYFYVEKEKYKVSLEKQFEKDTIKVHTKLEHLHQMSFKEKLEYPRYEEFESAIYDNDKNLIFSTMKSKNIDFMQKIYNNGNSVIFIHNVSPYYLGAAYIVIEKEGVSFLDTFDKRILFVPLAILLLIIITSYSIVKIILKPIQENIKALDDFIKDTTHELNTPIATIQSNLELLENTHFEPKVFKKINRIKIATINIKKLYEDLVFLRLNKAVQSNLETVDISLLVSERVDYFKLLLESKNIKIIVKENAKPIQEIDRSKLIRLMDNLLSNAIKYSHKETTITIEINQNNFKIQDQGIGMDQKDVENIFKRYTRFSTDTQSGFGIGYNIIYQIIKEYNLDIHIDSKKGVGTCVEIRF